MNEALEALRIVGGSWPLAALVVGCAIALAVRSIVRSVTRTTTASEQLRGDREVALARIKRDADQKTIEAPSRRTMTED